MTRAYRENQGAVSNRAYREMGEVANRAYRESIPQFCRLLLASRTRAQMNPEKAELFRDSGVYVFVE